MAKNTQIISFISGKCGIGNSTIITSLSKALTFIGNKILIVDFNIGIRTIDKILGIEEEVKYDISDALTFEKDIKEYMTVYKENRNLSLLASSLNNDLDFLNQSDINKLFNELKGIYDYIFIDVPHGINQALNKSIEISNSFIFSTTQESSSIRTIDKIIGLIKEKNIDNSFINQKVLINKFNQKEETITIEKINEILALDIIGVVPFEKKYKVCFDSKKSETSYAFTRIGKRILENKKLEATTVAFLNENEDAKLEKFINQHFKIF